jgi:hypothetical protein
MFRPATSKVSALWGFVANGRQTLHSVSFSLSKIPYGGFSPVRLQTGYQNNTFVHRHYTCGLIVVPSLGQHRTPLLPHCVGYGPALSKTFRVQRPLARRRVIVSQQVAAYYGLIRASVAHPTAYCSSSAGHLRSTEGPNFYLPVLVPVPSALPRRTWMVNGCSIAIRNSLRHVLNVSASAFFG